MRLEVQHMTRLMAAALRAAVLAGLPAATLARQSDESDEARRVREASVVFGEIMTAPAAPPARDWEPVPGHRVRARLLW